MVLSPTANWTTAFSSSTVADRFYVQITDGGTTWDAVSGVCDQISAPESILEVDPISAELDPLTRNVETGQIDIVCEDAWLRPIIVNNKISHQKVTVTLGAKELASGDFISYFLGIINKIQPLPNKEGIRLECMDAFNLLKTRKITGYWYNKHPLQIIKDILDKAGVPTSLYDSTSLDPSDSAYATISHYCTSRGASYFMGNHFAVRSPTEAWDLVQSIAELLNGQFVTTEAGVLKFILFDNSTSTDFAWTSDHILDFKTREIHANIINEYSVNWSRFSTRTYDKAEGGYTQRYTSVSDDSESDYAFPGESTRRLSESLDTGWLDQNAELQESITDSDTTIVVAGQLHAFSGFNWNGGSTYASQPSWAQLSGTKKIVLAIDDELITATGISALPSTGIDDNTAYLVIQELTGNTYSNLGPRPSHIQFTGCSRGAYGTTAAAHTGWDDARGGGGLQVAKVFDATIPVAHANAKIERFDEGIDFVEVTTDIREFKNQLGDIGTLVENTFVRFGKDGLDTGDAWEIVGKELDLNAKEIRWVLASATTSTPASSTSTVHPVARSNLIALESISKSAEDSTIFSPAIVHGLVVSNTSGFNIAVSAGSAKSDAAISQLEAATAFTVQASKDSFIYKNVVDGSIHVRALTTGSDPPIIDSNNVLLAKVVAGAGSVSSIDTTQRVTGTAHVAGMDTKEDNISSLGPNAFFDVWSRG